MTPRYTIYLVNLQDNIKKFWCFFLQPILGQGSKVYATSNVYLSVKKYIPEQSNTFSIPLQYSIGAGASNQTVDTKVVINSTFTVNTDLGQSWLVSYTQNGDHIGPIITENGTTDSQKINININLYDKAQEPINNWFGNTIYGIKSENGFIGMTWSPDPSDEYIITPNINLYIKTGDFEPNTPLGISEVKNNSIQIAESNFDAAQNCTVSLNTDGRWSITPGKPNINLLLQSTIIGAQHTLVKAQSNIIKMVEK